MLQKILNKLKGYIPDICLFYSNGKEYFNKIGKEEDSDNLKRLVTYVLFSALIQILLLTEKPEFDWKFIAFCARSIILQLPVLSLGYLIAFLFSKSSFKIKNCINYVVFQQAITGSIPIFFLALYLNFESFSLYCVYALSLVLFFCYILCKFAYVFFQGFFNRVLSVGIVICTIFAIGFVGTIIDVSLPTRFTMAFEDPIASEFYELQCFEETLDANYVVNSTQIKNKTADNCIETTIDYLANEPTTAKETELFVAMRRMKQLSYDWQIEKDKEFSRVAKRVDLLNKKVAQARFNKNKKILNKNIEMYMEYIQYLEEYDKSTAYFSGMEYSEISKVKKIRNGNADSVIDGKIQQVLNAEILGMQVDIMQLRIKLYTKVNSLTQKHIEVTDDLFKYMDFIKEVKRYFPLYNYKILF